MARTQRFFNYGKCICPFGLQFQAVIGWRNGKRSEWRIRGYFIASAAYRFTKIRQLHIQSSNLRKFRRELPIFRRELTEKSQRCRKKKKPANGKNRLQTEFSGGVGGIRTHGTRRYNWFRVSPVMTTSIPLRVFIFTSALKNTSEKGENWWRELRDIYFSMIAEKPRKIKVFQRWASKKGIRFRVRTLQPLGYISKFMLYPWSRPADQFSRWKSGRTTG